MGSLGEREWVWATNECTSHGERRRYRSPCQVGLTDAGEGAYIRGKAIMMSGGESASPGDPSPRGSHAPWTSISSCFLLIRWPPCSIFFFLSYFRRLLLIPSSRRPRLRLSNSHGCRSSSLWMCVVEASHGKRRLDRFRRLLRLRADLFAPQFSPCKVVRNMHCVLWTPSVF